MEETNEHTNANAIRTLEQRLASDICAYLQLDAADDVGLAQLYRALGSALGWLVYRFVSEHGDEEWSQTQCVDDVGVSLIEVLAPGELEVRGTLWGLEDWGAEPLQARFSVDVHAHLVEYWIGVGSRQYGLKKVPRRKLTHLNYISAPANWGWLVEFSGVAQASADE